MKHKKIRTIKVVGYWFPKYKKPAMIVDFSECPICKRQTHCRGCGKKLEN